MLKMCEEAMAKDEILAKLAIILMSFLKVTRGMIVPEANFINDLGADSLGLVELIMRVEDKFDVVTSCDAAEKVKTVGDLVEIIFSLEQEVVILPRPLRQELNLDAKLP